MNSKTGSANHTCCIIHYPKICTKQFKPFNGNACKSLLHFRDIVQKKRNGNATRLFSAALVICVKR